MDASAQNVFYYTFSTIAQTLAGAIALLAAFLLYRFQIMASALKDHAEFVRDSYSDEVDLLNILWPLRYQSTARKIALTRPAMSNKSLDASGGSVFRIMTGPAMLE
jgi:hypothetical protein